MPTTTIGTAAAAQVFLAFTVLSAPPTVSDIPRQELQSRPVQKSATCATGVATGLNVTTIPADSEQLETPLRKTTSLEELIGEIRGWSLLEANWDGEGASTPLGQSLKEAESFIRFLGDIALPEPMLLSSGHAALYWNDSGLYADLEFLGDGRIAYFIKRHEDKHKGVLAFDSKEMPAVFPALIQA